MTAAERPDRARRYPVAIVGSPPMTDVLIAKQQSLARVRHAWLPS